MRYAFPLLLCGLFSAVPAVTGCGDREVSKETTTVRSSGGDVKQTEKKVTQSSDGKTTETTTEKTNNP